MNRRDITVTIVLNVDADGARLLPGCPGSSSLDGTEAIEPVEGVELAVYAEVNRLLRDALPEALPTVIDTEFVGIDVSLGPTYDPSTLDF